MNDKRYNQLTPYIHEVSSRLSLKDDDVKVANEYFTTIVNEHLIPEMKNDEYFNKIFRRVHYTGSYYENLRINEPNEFDLNLELKSGSRNEKFFQIFCNRTPPGYVQIQYKSGDISGKWINEDGFVLQHKVFSWLQSVVDKALNKIRSSSCRILRKTSGPAVTLYVEYGCGKHFSVDLVPVFVFDDSQWLKPPVRQPLIDKEYAQVWCVVPKPFNNDVEYSETFWRISFYTQEKEYLNNQNHLKNALKITKLLRDEEGWHCLSSYYLKTVYLWALMENKMDFSRSGIGIIFMNMLYLLKDYLKEKYAIPFFWDERHNLLSSVNKAEIEKIGNRIENFLRYINRNIDNPVELKKFFDSHFRGGNSYRGLRIVEVTEPEEQDGLQLVPRPLQQPRVSPWFQNSPRMSSEDDSDQSLATVQDGSFDWTTLAVGIGALALTGTFLYRATRTNRDN